MFSLDIFPTKYLGNWAQAKERKKACVCCKCHAWPAGKYYSASRIPFLGRYNISPSRCRPIQPVRPRQLIEHTSISQSHTHHAYDFHARGHIYAAPICEFIRLLCNSTVLDRYRYIYIDLYVPPKLSEPLVVHYICREMSIILQSLDTCPYLTTCTLDHAEMVKHHVDR